MRGHVYGGVQQPPARFGYTKALTSLSPPTTNQALARPAWPRLRALEFKGNYLRHPSTLARLLATVEARRAAGLGSLQVLSLGPHDNMLGGVGAV